METSACALGVRTGEILSGSTHIADVNGTVLKCVWGSHAPLGESRRKVLEETKSTQAWSKRVGSALGMSASKASLMLSQPAPNDSLRLLGCATNTFRSSDAAFTARFVILRVGEKWQGPSITEALEQQRELTGPELAGLLHQDYQAGQKNECAGFLALRANQWFHEPLSAIVEDADLNDAAIWTHHLFGNGSAHVYKIRLVPASESTAKGIGRLRDSIRRHGWHDTLMVTVPPSAPVELTRYDTVLIVKSIFHRRQSTVDWVFRYLESTRFRPAFYKSVMQKIVRTCATTVTFPAHGPPEGRLERTHPVDAELVMACVIAIAITNRGSSFNTQIGKHVRGCTMVFKRLAVIINEDGGNQGLVPKLLAFAAVCGEASYVPSADVLEWLIREIKHSMRPLGWAYPKGIGVIKWRSNEAIEARIKAGTIVESKDNFWAPTAEPSDWLVAARLLERLGSFASDIDMSYQTALMFHDKGMDVPVLHPSGDTPLQYNMPIWHAFDQHVSPGLALIPDSMPKDHDGKDPFASRLRHIWSSTTGFNPRLRGQTLTDPCESVRFAQRMFLKSLDVPAVKESDVTRQREVFALQLDNSEFTAGVGNVDVDVKTLAVQNRADGLPNEDISWKLRGSFGHESDSMEFVWRPTAHGDAGKKPKVSATARKLARQHVMQRASREGLPFDSPVLPDCKVAFYTMGRWCLGTKDATQYVWNFEHPTQQITMELHINEAVPEMDFMESDVATDSIVEIAYNGGLPGIMPRAFDRIQAIMQKLGPKLGRRLVTMVLNASDTIRMPTPSMQGQQGKDQARKPLFGDWLVYRALLFMSMIVPAALRPVQAPFFEVLDGRPMRLLRGWILDTAPRPAPQTQREGIVGALRAIDARIDAALVSQGAELADYQKSLIHEMHRRSLLNNGVKGHFVALDTGLGKTLLGIKYLIQAAIRMDDARGILWFTPVKKDAMEEFKKWGITDDEMCIKESDKDDRFQLITIVPYTSLSRSNSDGFHEMLVSKAVTSLCCFDELHLLYNEGVRRNDAALRCAFESPELLMMTATPPACARQKLAIQWVQFTVPYIVTDRNMLSAALRMISAKVEYPFTWTEEVEKLTIEETTRAEHVQLANENWLEAFHCVRNATIEQLVRIAMREAVADRVENPDGGTLLIADSAPHADALVAKCNEIFGDGNASRREFPEGTPHVDTPLQNASVRVVVVPRCDCNGWNGPRLGRLVTLPYPSNAHSRHQIRGRLKRFSTQKRKQLKFLTVVPRGTMLELLHKRHSSHDTKVQAMQDLAKEFASHMGAVELAPESPPKYSIKGSKAAKRAAEGIAPRKVAPRKAVQVYESSDEENFLGSETD